MHEIVEQMNYQNLERRATVPGKWINSDGWAFKTSVFQCEGDLTEALIVSSVRHTDRILERVCKIR